MKGYKGEDVLRLPKWRSMLVVPSVKRKTKLLCLVSFAAHYISDISERKHLHIVILHP